jgi:hypothetical protein
MACSPRVPLPALLVLADLQAAPVVAVMTFAIVITLAGHINRNYKVVAIGLAVLFLATFAMILSAYLSYTDTGSCKYNPAFTTVC